MCGSQHQTVVREFAYYTVYYTELYYTEYSCALLKPLSVCNVPTMEPCILVHVAAVTRTLRNVHSAGGRATQVGSLSEYMLVLRSSLHSHGLPVTFTSPPAPTLWVYCKSSACQYTAIDRSSTTLASRPSSQSM